MAADRFISPCPPPDGAARETLTILAEEGSEMVEIVGEMLTAVSRMQVRTSKCLRFGLDEVQPGQRLTNADRLGSEIGDLLGVVDLLCRFGVLDARLIDDCRTAKVGKLAKFMQTQAVPKDRERARPDLPPEQLVPDSDRGAALKLLSEELASADAVVARLSGVGRSYPTRVEPDVRACLERHRIRLQGSSMATEDKGGALPPSLDEDGTVVYRMRIAPGMTDAEINAAADEAMRMPVPITPAGA